MGIKLPVFPFADTDCYCFPAGKAPLHIYASVSGIAKGDIWAPGSPEPPNGSYRLTKGAACFWSGQFGFWSIAYGSELAGASFGISHTVFPEEDAFLGATASCQGGFSNMIDSPVDKFWYGGSAQVTWKPPSPSPSLANIMNEVISENFEGWKAEVTPFSETEFVARMANRNGKSCVHVKYNPYL